jgi:hypothetical protein
VRSHDVTNKVVILSGSDEPRMTAIAARLAIQLDNIALVDVGLLRAMAWQSHNPHRNDDLAQSLAVHNACLLARAFLEAGYRVVICDTVTPQTAPIYRTHLSDVRLRIVLLAPIHENAVEWSARPSRVLIYDEKIDSSFRTADELANAIDTLLVDDSPAEVATTRAWEWPRSEGISASAATPWSGARTPMV